MSLPEQVRGPASLLLRDVSGRVLLRQNAAGPMTVLDLRGVVPGTYVVEVAGRALATRSVVE